MITIYKYPIQMKDQFTIEMPYGAQVLSVQTQRETPCIWALVDSDNWPEKRPFALRGTGHDCSGLNEARFVGTFQLHGGALVFHLFDVKAD